MAAMRALSMSSRWPLARSNCGTRSFQAPRTGGETSARTTATPLAGVGRFEREAAALAAGRRALLGLRAEIEAVVLHGHGGLAHVLFGDGFALQRGTVFAFHGFSINEVRTIPVSGNKTRAMAVLHDVTLTGESHEWSEPQGLPQDRRLWRRGIRVGPRPRRRQLWRLRRRVLLRAALGHPLGLPGCAQSGGRNHAAES